jgi:hypothetical protein
VIDIIRIAGGPAITRDVIEQDLANCFSAGKIDGAGSNNEYCRSIDNRPRAAKRISQ